MRKLICFFTILICCFSAFSKNKVEHIIFLGIDGFSSYHYPSTDMPTLNSMIESGSCTFSKRSEIPSKSAQNWASIFMGVPMEIHGYTEWNSKIPEIPEPISNIKNNIMPTVLQVVKESYPEYEVGCLCEWDGILHLVDTLSCNYHYVHKNYLEEPDFTTDRACEYIARCRPNFFAIIYDVVDRAGHNYGWGSGEYLSTCNFLDSQFARIIESVKDAGILDKTVFIVTSDHGGIDNAHGGISLEELETPFVISGIGIKQGYKIPDLMMQYDVSSVILDLFEIDQPHFWRGKKLEIKDQSGVNSFLKNNSGNNDNSIVSKYDLLGRTVVRKSQNQIIIETDFDTDQNLRCTKKILNSRE